MLCIGAWGRVFQYDVTMIVVLKIQPLKYITNFYATRLGHAQYLVLRRNEVPQIHSSDSSDKALWILKSTRVSWCKVLDLANNYNPSPPDHVACLEITSRISDRTINKKLPRSLLVFPDNANVMPFPIIITSKWDVSEDESKYINFYNTNTSKEGII